MSVTDPAVELHSVTKLFGHQKAVDSVDLVVPKGSIYGFIGPNGSGKTTTMRMILRIYKPDAGTVEVLGSHNHDLVDSRVGYLPEERGLYRRMTVRRILRFFGRLKGVRHPDAIIDQFLEKFGAKDWANKRIDQLSKGMAQKIQFIVAVIASPELVILDEPFSGLDPVNMEMLRDAVLEIRANGGTVIFSTHDMDMAERMCDRVFMIYQGRKVLDGTMDSIQNGYGVNSLRVRMSDPSQLPDRIPGVSEIRHRGRFTELFLEAEEARPGVLRTLSEAGDVEHFETVRPSLHDIFIRIAKVD